MLSFAEAAQAVLDDDNGPIDDQAEVQRAEAHQITGGAGLDHAGDGHQHSHRNDRCCDQGRTDVPEQQKQHDDDQQGPFEQVFLDGVDGALDEVSPVIDRNRAHPGG